VFDRGLLVPTGHADFYVNGGFNQPGCAQQTETSAGSCNHDRASVYYAESINSKLGFIGYRCGETISFFFFLFRLSSSLQPTGTFTFSACAAVAMETTRRPCSALAQTARK
jgi:hypothetical protein